MRHSLKSSLSYFLLADFSNNYSLGFLDYSNTPLASEYWFCFQWFVANNFISYILVLNIRKMYKDAHTLYIT